jgi:hypothetical protein
MSKTNIGHAPLMTELFTESDGDAFTRHWMRAWNAHDVDAITEHYRDDVEYESPFVAALGGGDGRLHGADALRGYVAAALERYPDLYFDVRSATVATGASSIAMAYRSVNDLLAIETLVLDGDRKVARALCHYRNTHRREP